MAKKRNRKARKGGARRAGANLGPAVKLNSLGRHYARIKRSIVAIADITGFDEELLVKRGELFPEIIGTGVIVDGRGAIVTNAHVTRAMKERNRTSGAIFKAYAFIHEDGNCGVIGMEVIETRSFEGSELANFVQPAPALPADVGIVFVDHRDLPAVEMSLQPGLYEGMDVAFSGFPIGRTLLQERQRGNLIQLNPTLRAGRLAAIQPYPHPSRAHGLLLDALGQPGYSGSPVFSPETGKIVGLVWGGVDDPHGWRHGFTYAVPSYVVAAVLVGGGLKGLTAGRVSYADFVARGWEKARSQPGEIVSSLPFRATKE